MNHALSQGRAAILLVDDHQANLIGLGAVLSDPGYDLVLARTAQEALERLREREFAVILSDVRMPLMDSIQLANRAREIQSAFETPIIFLTSGDDDKERLLQAYSAGAVDFLPEPYEPVVVKAKVAVFVRLFKQRIHIADQAKQL
ncbi:MAG: response regulator, partial [Pseudobdellovibrionaceae bacterium]|nr:response regulator [Pseudobdellovibrionaceae bacterium]